MTPMDHALKQYAILVCNHQKYVFYQLCRSTLPSKEVERHMFSVHEDYFPDRHRCPWCLGNYSWPPRQKYRHAEHLTACFKRYWRNSREKKQQNNDAVDENNNKKIRCVIDS